MCRTVVLPAPFGPSRPVTPGFSVMVMSLTATTLPYQRETLTRSTVVTAPPFVCDCGARFAHSSRSQCRHPTVAGEQEEQAGDDEGHGLDAVHRAEPADVDAGAGAGQQPGADAADQRHRAGQPGQLPR